MLFWLSVIILVVGIIAVAVGYWIEYNTRYYAYWLQNIGWVLTVLMSIVIVVSGIVMLDSYGNVDANVALIKERYKSLTYQLENNLYNDDNDLGKKELYNQIQEWNEDVVYYQNIQDNFWYGIYYPDVFDQFKTIDYAAYE